MRKVLKCTMLLLLLMFANILKAQIWSAAVPHNGYSCNSFKTVNNIVLYAAKGLDGSMETLFIKIKVPYNWNNTNIANIKYFRKNLATGAAETQSGFFNYKNGWLYFAESLSGWCSSENKRGSNPCYTYTITLYKENDHGYSGSDKIVVNTNLDKLNTDRMIMNELAFETYW